MIVFDSWPLSKSNSRKSQRNSSERFYFNESPRSHQDTVRYQCRFTLANLFAKWRIWFMISSDSEFTGTYNSFHASAFLDVFITHVRSGSYKFIFSHAPCVGCNTITLRKPDYKLTVHVRSNFPIRFLRYQIAQPRSHRTKKTAVEITLTFWGLLSSVLGTQVPKRPSVHQQYSNGQSVINTKSFDFQFPTIHPMHWSWVENAGCNLIWNEQSSTLNKLPFRRDAATLILKISRV